MHLDPEDLRRLRSAYQVFGLPLSSTAAEIEREFGRLATTWHPDKWPAGSPQQAKAADRMRDIELAFEAIRHAPLRDHIEGHPRVAARAAARGREVAHESVPLTDRTEYAVRFVLGALFGLVMLGVRSILGGPQPTPVWILLPALIGLGSAYLGNRFWEGAFNARSWWDRFWR